MCEDLESRKGSNYGEVAFLRILKNVLKIIPKYNGSGIREYQNLLHAGRGIRERQNLLHAGSLLHAGRVHAGRLDCISKYHM